MPNDVTPPMFIAKWSRTTLPERAASQEHFIDLCRMLGQPTPAEHDATGAEYTFEKGVTVSGSASKGSQGESGFADVWWKGKFALEYKRKGKYKDLADAYRQLLQYREALENPPLLIVSDIARIEIHTNFTGTAKQIHAIALAEMDQPENLARLRRVFTDPDSFRPQVTAAAVTEEVAQQIGRIALGLHERGAEPHAAAHFLMKCMFCLFAEDVRLLPAGVFKRLLQVGKREPKKLTGLLTELFKVMREGGYFGADEIQWFNGGLFDEAPALDLTGDEIEAMLLAAEQDWGAVEPAIFGTLFERSLDPSKRAQIGAHYTSREDIMLIVEPVVMAPLRREWGQVQADVAGLLERRDKAKTRDTKRRHDEGIGKAIDGFLERLSSARILDPACGSGNFLYVAIQQLLGLEKEVITFAARPDIGLGLFPRVRPAQLHGVEINPYAAELAQVVIWIGYLQWMRDNGFVAPRDPILEPLTTVECRDAILAWEDADGQPLSVWSEGATCTGAATWPEADFIIGNPPFLGSKVFRQNGLPDEYVKAMYAGFELPKASDLCCYWFELGRKAIGTKAVTRVGLLATQGIRGGENRRVLERIKGTGGLFMAWSDREWVLDGAAVHVSLIGFSGQPEPERTLNGRPVPEINADLSFGDDLTSARILAENQNMAFMGDTKGGAFDIEWAEARSLLMQPNPNGRSGAEVVRPWINGMDVTQRTRCRWIIDFGCEMTKAQAAGYEGAFQIVADRVQPERSAIRQKAEAETWWLHNRPRGEMREAIRSITRFPVTTRVSKHRLFSWFSPPVLPDSATFAFARSDDYFFGVLHSAVHELWALRMGTQLEDRPRYTPTTCFETFPLPWSPGHEPESDPLYGRIAEAARTLNEQRERWLNPPEWIAPLAERIDAADDFGDVPEEARGLIRHSAIMAAAAQDGRLKKRTLTNLYNERPTWLRMAHEALDRAVLAAYAAVDPEGAWAESFAEVWAETGAGQPLPDGHGLAERRAEVDQQVLGDLLRMNLERSTVAD